MKPLQILMFFLISAVYGENDYLQDYINKAQQNNPALQAAQKNYEAENARIHGLGTLEAPTLNIGFYPEPVEQKHGKQVADISVMQMFNWFGTQKAEQTEAKAMSKMQNAKVQNLKNEITAKVKSEWYNLTALKKKIEYTKEILNIQKQMENLLIEEYKALGKESYSSILDINIRISELEFEVEAMQSELQSSSANFNALLGQNTAEEINLSDTLFLAEPNTQRSTENPMVEIINAESEALKSQKDMLLKMSYPMIGLGFQYMVLTKYPDMPTSGKDMYMLMAQITLPIWRSKTNANINEAMLKREAAQKSMINIKNELEAQKIQAKKQMELTKKKIELYKKQKELLDSKLKIITQNITVNKGKYSEVLQINIDFLYYKIKEIEAIAQYNSTVAFLESLF